MLQGVKYYVIVKAISSWGGFGFTVAPAPIVFDMTPSIIVATPFIAPTGMTFPGIQTGDSGINWRILDDYVVLVEWIKPTDPESPVVGMWARVSTNQGQTMLDWTDVLIARTVLNVKSTTLITDGTGTDAAVCGCYVEKVG